MSETQPTASAPSDKPAAEGWARRWLFPLLRIALSRLRRLAHLVHRRTLGPWTGAARFESTDDAFVSGDVTPLSARVSGNITEMPVNDFQLVRKGDLLAVIDPSDYQAQLDLAQANLAAAEATLANLANQRIVQQSLVQQAEATIDATEADVLRYQLEDKRQRDLLRTGIAGTQQLVEQADDNAKRALAQRRLNAAQLDQQKAALAAIDIQEKQLKAQIHAAEAQLALAADNLRYTRILAPADGLVGQRQVRLGQFVNVGTQVIAVVPLPNIWVIANYKETQMTNVRLGQPARISVDAFPDLKLTGHVDSWSPGTGSTFALLPPDNATGNFTKVVQRVPVKLVLDQNESLGSLVRPGMSVEATIDTGAPPGQSGAAASVAPAMTAVPAALARASAEPPAPAPITCAGIAAHQSGTRYIRLSPDTLRPYIGILGVLIGAILSFTGSRITTFGLADLRGGLHFGFDEGAWMTTSFGVGQMLVGVACPYLGAIFSVRRILLHGMALLFIAVLLGPLSPNLTAFLTAQFLAGVGTGTFIPLTIGFIVRNLPQRLVVYGLAVYAMNSELSQNVSASLEGWFTDNLSWRWILWQFCIALPLMFACIWYGAPREKINLALLRDLDWPGLAYSGLGFALLYAGLDQGNRLDWVNNGLVNGLLLSGSLLTLAFVVRELVIERPFLNLRLLTREGIVPILLILAGFRFIILSTAYIIPTYLQVVQNYRELQVGAVLLWIALPQFLIVLPLGWLLSRIDARWILAIGAIFIGVACLMGTFLTQDWATDDFLPSQILQAIGQSFALTAVVVLAVKSMNPADVLTIGTLFQTVRLFGGEIGTAFMQTFVRVREQVHSNLIGLHVDSLGGMTADRLAAYRNVVGAHTSDVAAAAARATSLLGAAVAKQAAVLSYIDGFLAAAVGAFVCLLLTALLRRH